MDMLEDTAQSPGRPREHQFGQLLMYQDTQLVSWFDTSLFVIDPGLGTLAGYHTSLGTLRDVSVCDDEIFILRDHKERPIVRIAQKPDLRFSPGRNNFVSIDCNVKHSVYCYFYIVTIFFQ